MGAVLSVVLAALAQAEGDAAPEEDLSWSRGDVTLGTGVTAFPAQSGSVLPVSELSAAVHVFRPVSLVVQARASLHWTEGTGIGAGAGLGVRVPFATYFFARAALGFGVMTTCVTGDWCGGLGFSANAELGGALFRPGPHLVILLRVHVQTGMVNGVGVALSPTLNVGLGW